MSDITKKLWVEKYAPENLEDMILPDSFRTKFQSYINEGECPHLLLSGTQGSGKAQPLYCKILTPTGYTTMKDIKVGDNIINKEGSISKVLNIFPQGIKPIYKITFKDHTFTYCCEDHLWIAKKYKKFKVISLKNIIKNDQTRVNKRKWKIPLVKPIKFKKKKLDIDPYLLGCLLGDGCFREKHAVGITIHDNDYQIIEECKKVLPDNIEIVKKKSSKYNYNIKMITRPNIKNIKNISHNNIIKFLIKTKLKDKTSKEKFIPEIYKYSSIEDRISLLQGLMDTDGCVINKNRTNRVIFYSSSKQLIEDVLFLVNSLGGKGLIRNRKIKLNNKIFYSYLIDINLPKEIVPFRLQRKKQIYNKIVKHIPERIIDKIEYIKDEECQCIQTSSKDGSYITDNMIVTHNTTISKILINNIIKDDADILLINGSKDNGVDYIRNTLDSFLVCPPYGSKIKICMIDEADYLSGNAQAALRGIIERYQETARFIMTINYPHKIIEPLKSRLQLFEFKKLPFEYIKNHIEKILKKEFIEYDSSMVDKIIKSYYPDVRRIIGTIEKSCENNKLINNVSTIEEVENEIINYFTKILDSIENNDMHILKISITNIQNIINGDNGVDYLSLYDRLFNHDKIPFYAKLCIGESLENFPSAAVPSIHFITCILKVIKAGLAAKNIKFYV